MSIFGPDKDDFELLVAEVAELRAQVAVLTRAKEEAEHVHDYQYTKTRLGRPDSFGGVTWVWGWKCEASGCTQPRGGTNHVGGIPEHFPKELR